MATQFTVNLHWPTVYSFFLSLVSVTLPDSVELTLKKADRAIFPNIFTALRILCISPVIRFHDDASNESRERLRNFLLAREEMWFKPEPLALLYAHRDIDIDLDEVVNKYKSKMAELAASSSISCCTNDEKPK